MTQSTATVPLARVQGNIVPGFQKDNQSFVLIEFPDRHTGQAWLKALLPEIASAKQVFAFKALLKLVPSGIDDSAEIVTSRWTNVALTYRGLQLVGSAADMHAFPAAFKDNRVPWSRLEPGQADVHAILILAADQLDHLDEDLARHQRLLERAGVRELRLYRGQALPDRREHFGFRDGVSQPIVAGTPDAEVADRPPTPAGEFILGAVDAFGTPAVNGPGWSRYGSFLAFIELQQHVAVFRQAMRREAARLGIAQDILASWIVGRQQNGDALVPAPPRPSHIGRAHPSWLTSEAERRRILRRGIAYGPPLGDGDDADGLERGLLFLAYQADIARQFEHVWAQWLNGPNFPSPSSGRDGLVGQADPLDRSSSPSRPTLVSSPGSSAGGFHLRLPQFVTPRYGGYFFAPSLDALPLLAGST